MGHKKKRIMRKYDRKKLGWLQLFKQIVVVVVLALLVLNILIGVSRVDGVSMVPTLKNKRIVMYWRLGDNYKTGDVVAIKMPNGDKYVKRVIGVPGDEIDIKDGFVYINGQQLHESYVNGGDGNTKLQNADIKYPYKVENDTFFVMGDNRAESMDSRTFGAVIRDNIKGVLLLDY
jgi:signal peptidase I